MSKNRLTTNLTLALTSACLLWAGGWTDQPARAQHAEHRQPARPGEHSPGGKAPATAARRAPHGGQLTNASHYLVEVVYRPRETRVYFYEPSLRPLTARRVQGEVAMKVQGHEQVFRYPLEYVAPPAGSRDQDYLVAKVDVSRVPDGSMMVTLGLTGLPHPEQPRITLTQRFALSSTPLTVTVAALSKADQSGIDRQQVCPVSGGRLGAMGPPLKVLIGDAPVYLCCQGCLAKVRKDPARYLRKVYPATSGSKAPSGSQLTVARATAADQAAIRAQRVCVVTGAPLGGMGTPVKVTLDGQVLFLCCEGCVGKVRVNPETYFRRAAQLHPTH